jgi:hypothetical protein
MVVFVSEMFLGFDGIIEVGANDICGGYFSLESSNDVLLLPGSQKR